MKLKWIILILVLIFSFFSYISIRIIEFKTGYDIEAKITGLASFGAGLLLSRPRSASFIVIFIIVAIIYYFNRKRIKGIIWKIKERKR